MIYENTPTIETERLILRKFTQTDITDMLLLYSDEEVNKFLPFFPMTSIAEVTKYLHEVILPCYEKEIAYSYAITMKSDNKVIGYVHVNDMGNSNDIGYALRREFWHKGIVTEATKAVTKQIKDAGYTYITATHDINNPNSGEVMKNLGMTYKYSYVEQWQPKNIAVTFRMYELNFDGNTERTYMEYWNKYDNHFIEENIKE